MKTAAGLRKATSAARFLRREETKGWERSRGGEGPSDSDSPSQRTHGHGAVPPQRQVFVLGEGVDRPLLVQDDHQVRHLQEEGVSDQSLTR